MIIGLIVLVCVLILGFLVGKTYAAAQFKSLEKQIREDTIKRSRSVLGGKFSENIAPYLPGFDYDPTDARFIGSPIDFLVFPGLSTGEPTEVVLIEVKSGKARLSTKERKIRDLIKEKKVRWELYQVPEEVTGKKE